MPRTFQDTLQKDAAACTSPNFHGETITHYPAGDLSAGEEVDAIVDRDAEDGGGIGEGEGAAYDTREGVKLRRTAVLELPIATNVTESSGQATSPSVFEFDNLRWRAVRILGRDSAMQAVLVTRLDKLAARRTSRR